MLSNSQKQKLKSSWGDKSLAMDCFAEVRLYDDLSPWECYIFAMNPQDENEISCLIHDIGLSILESFSMDYILSYYNSEGEGVKVDHEYRPRLISEIYKKLKEIEIYERD